ncbi:MAG: glycosyltransferase family 2 protein, partial [Acidimicrobiales bacterium]
MTSLSLVICTRNRAHLLVRALAAVEAAAKPPGFELVVVDNGSGDATGAVIGAHAARAGQPVLTVAEPRVGLSRARNAGVAAASGEVVAFTDDDCLIRPDHLTGVAAAFAELPIAFCGGRVVAADPADSPVALNLDPTFRWLPPGRPLRPGVVQGANLAVRADALRAAAVGPGPGPFDEALGAGAGARCEDVELCARLL